MGSSSWVRRKSHTCKPDSYDVGNIILSECRQELAEDPGSGGKEVGCDELVLNGLVSPKKAEFLKKRD